MTTPESIEDVSSYVVEVDSISCVYCYLLNCHTDKTKEWMNLFIDYYLKYIDCFNHLSKARPYSSLVPC